MGIISWAYKCMAFAEDMQKEFIGALEEHDAAITRADLPGLHGACLSALRTRMHQLEAGQPSDSTPQLVSIKRMEVRVEQMQKQLANKQEVEQTLRTTVHGLQKENIALQEVLRYAIHFLSPNHLAQCYVSGNALMQHSISTGGCTS